MLIYQGTNPKQTRKNWCHGKPLGGTLSILPYVRIHPSASKAAAPCIDEAVAILLEGQKSDKDLARQGFLVDTLWLCQNIY